MLGYLYSTYTDNCLLLQLTTVTSYIHIITQPAEPAVSLRWAQVARVIINKLEGSDMIHWQLEVLT